MIATVLYLAVAASNPVIAPETQRFLERSRQIDEFAVTGPEFLKQESEGVIRALGKVKAEKSEVVKSPYDQTLELKYTTLAFVEGLEITFRTFGSPIVTHLVHITVSSPRWPIKHGLRVGTPVAKVIEVLGEPTKREANRLEYEGETEHVTFLVKKGAIEGVEFAYHAE